MREIGNQEAQTILSKNPGSCWFMLLPPGAGLGQEKKEGASVTPHRGEDCTYCLFSALASRLVSGCEKEAVSSIDIAVCRSPTILTCVSMHSTYVTIYTLSNIGHFGYSGFEKYVAIISAMNCSILCVKRVLDMPPKILPPMCFPVS